MVSPVIVHYWTKEFLYADPPFAALDRHGSAYRRATRWANSKRGLVAPMQNFRIIENFTQLHFR
jgi:hypothetical protein